MSDSSKSDSSGGGAMESSINLRLSVRKDLFPEPQPEPVEDAEEDDLLSVADVFGVKLETDFEASIDNIAMQKKNEIMAGNKKGNHKLDQASLAKTKKHDSKFKKSKKRRSAELESDDDFEPPSKTKVPISEVKSLERDVKERSGKPYSHKLSQLSKKKCNYGGFSTPPTGKPRGMISFCDGKKKNSKKNSVSELYQSQLIDSANNLKIKIKKASISHTKHQVPAVTTPPPIKRAPKTKSSGKKKKLKSSSPSSSGDEFDPSHSDSATTAFRPKQTNHKVKRETPNRVKEKAAKAEVDRGPQSVWGEKIPEAVLVKIFEHVTLVNGCLPNLIRLGRVCKLWHRASVVPSLWRYIDLNQYTREKNRVDYKLLWLLENRLTGVDTLNLSNWKVDNMSYVCETLVRCCGNTLRELNITGWDRLLPDQLLQLVVGLNKLQRIDLSLMCESGTPGPCLTAACLSKAAADLGSRLTHFIIANNKFTALTQILTSIANNCPNLEVLDISGAKAVSHSAVVPLCELQEGCPKLRVLRAANAQLIIPTGSGQPDGPGFPQLEELSIAADWGGMASLAVNDYRLEDEGLARILKNATRLKLLDVRGCRITGSGLVRVPVWDLQHLFLASCHITRQKSSCLELICEKWAHSLVEVDFSWATVAGPLDTAVEALSDKGDSSQLRILNLCGSAVSLEPVKRVLLRCPKLESLNLSSCRALPRGMKRLYTGKELQDLKDSYDPSKPKAKAEEEKPKKTKKKAEDKPADVNSVDVKNTQESNNVSESPSVKTDVPVVDNCTEKKTLQKESLKESSETKVTYASPDSGQDVIKENMWTLNNFKSVTNKPQASPCSDKDTAKTNHNPSMLPIQDLQAPEPVSTPGWGYGNYSPMARPEGQIPQQHSPYSTHPSPYSTTQPSPYSSQRSPYSSQRSPYSSQHSPFSTQPSPYSAQPSPYSAQPSPDTSQIVQKQWNVGSYSPATKPHLHYSVQASPDPGPGAGFSPATIPECSPRLTSVEMNQYQNCQVLSMSPNIRNESIKGFTSMNEIQHDVTRLPHIDPMTAIGHQSPDTNMLTFVEPR